MSATDAAHCWDRHALEQTEGWTIEATPALDDDLDPLFNLGFPLLVGDPSDVELHFRIYDEDSFSRNDLRLVLSLPIAEAFQPK